MNKNALVPHTLVINEIFFSIQGESLFMGCPCAFIRLSGCNLRCSYCDTTYAHNEGSEMDFESILKVISTFPCQMVEITGGEPLLQKNTPFLVRQLLDQGYNVLIETNGSFGISDIDARCVVIMDVKCPSSGESHRNIYTNFKDLKNDDQIKFVIRDKEDYDFAKEVLETHKIPIADNHILFSPVTDVLHPSELACWILEDGLSVRLHLQLHKYIWPDIERGV